MYQVDEVMVPEVVGASTLPCLLTFCHISARKLNL